MLGLYAALKAVLLLGGVCLGAQLLRRLTSKRIDLRGRHVLITGGSEGIGVALATRCALEGCKLTLVSRSLEKLQRAKQQIESAINNKASCSINVVAADVRNRQQVFDVLNSIEGTIAPLDIIVCNVGSSKPGYFVDKSLDEFVEYMDWNYMTAVTTVKAALPHLLKRRQGHIVVVSSLAALVGVFGYSSYSPAKAALRNFADVLRQELISTGVGVSIAYPPNTDTAGYQEEIKLEPGELKHVNATLGNDVYTPDQVAACMLNDLKAGAYHIGTPDFLGNLVVSLQQGVTPTYFVLPLAVLLAPLQVIAAATYSFLMDRTVAAYRRKHGATAAHARKRD